MRKGRSFNKSNCKIHCFWWRNVDKWEMLVYTRTKIKNVVPYFQKKSGESHGEQYAHRMLNR